MSNNGEKSKKSSSFAMLSQKMNEVQKSKKPSQVTSFKSNQKANCEAENSSVNLSRSNSNLTIDLEDNMSPPKGSESPKGSGSNQSVDRDPNVPDRSYGDYFCPLCDSHMNSDGMWVAHISGKRHMKNVDKGSKDPKYDDLDVESCIKQEIRNVKDPIIGLSYIHEIRRKDKGAPSIFTCFLCQATFPTVPLTIEHILNMKHRMNFMKENCHDQYQLLEATQLKKGQMEPLVNEMALKMEQKYGRGSVKVKQEKLKVQSAFPSKRSLEADDEKEKHPRKYLKSDDKDSLNDAHFSKNKKVNVFEKDKYDRDIDRRRRYSSSEDDDRYKQHCSPPRKQRMMNPTYPKRYESSHSRDSHKKDYFLTKKTVSSMRSFHSRSPPPRESIKENYKVAYGPELPPFPSSSSVQFKEKTPISSHNQSSSAENKDDSQNLKEFVHKIIKLSPEIFFKIVNIKLENLDLKSLEEFELIIKMIVLGQKAINQKIPDFETVLKQKLSQSSEAALPSNSPQSTMHQLPLPPLPNRPPQSQGLGFIKDYLDGKKFTSVVSSSISPPVGGGVGVQSYITPSYANQMCGSSSQVYGSSSQTYGNSSQAYGNQTVNPTTHRGVNSYQSNNPALENYSSSYQNNSCNSAISSNSSGIPGLTLAEENRQNYSLGIQPNQSSHYPTYGY